MGEVFTCVLLLSSLEIFMVASNESFEKLRSDSVLIVLVFEFALFFISSEHLVCQLRLRIVARVHAQHQFLHVCSEGIGVGAAVEVLSCSCQVIVPNFRSGV